MNADKLNELFHSKRLRLNRGGLSYHVKAPKSQDFDFGRVEGMLLGIAVGDALGITTEGMLPARRRAKYGELRDYIPNRYVKEARGFPSDDTQLAFWTLAWISTEHKCLTRNNSTLKPEKEIRRSQASQC
jgi:ADP-ribosyl-[dinitrogen reductase] hydrolase